MLWNLIKDRLWIACACLLFLAGAVIHLELLHPVADRVWGDEGDGFFNLWLMDHTYELCRQGQPGGIPDGRIFAPEESNTFFWSDNLLVPAIPYSGLRMAGCPRFTAFLWTGYLLASLFYGSLCFLFHQGDRLGRRSHAGWPSWSSWCIPFLAYAAFFTPGILGNYFQHFQNLSAFWLFFMTGAMIAYFRKPAGWPLCLVALCQTALLFSSLYFAVIGFVLILLWAGFEAMRDARQLIRIAIRTLPLLLPLLLCAGWIALQYHRIPDLERPGGVIKQLSVALEQVYTPSAGLLRDLLDRGGITAAAVHHEKPAYPGIGVLFGMALLMPIAILAAMAALRRDKETRWIPVFLLALALCVCRIRGMETLRGVVGVMALSGILLLALRFCVRQCSTHPVRAMAVLLLVMAVAVYGIANGPRTRFTDAPANPSLWGVFALLVPGTGRMRAVGRLAVVGQALLMAMAFLMAMRYAARNRTATGQVVAALLVAAVLQGADVLPLRANSKPYAPDHVTPDLEEQAFLETLDGTALVLPAKPFHRNAQPMLFFSRFLNLRLMNGYSSRSTPLWDGIMDNGATEGEGCPQQVAAARANGADWLIIFKYGIHRHWLKELYAQDTKPVFDNTRLLILPLQR
jgi:hypothetical protein